MSQMPIVTGVGIVTPLGYNAQATCAAIRAGISQFTEQDIVDRHCDPVVASRIEELGPLRENAVDIATICCREAVSKIPREHFSQRPVTISILQNENNRQCGPFLTDQDVKQIAANLGLISFTVNTYPFGNAAGMKAVIDAQNHIDNDPNALQIILGLDSLLEVKTLAHFESMDRLKSASLSRGIIPGEACACITIESHQAAQRGTQRGRALIAGVGVSVENAVVCSEDPCLGEGLTNAIFDGLQKAEWSGETVGQVYCDLNGEVYRVHEWMLALCRTLSDPVITHPADCMGDIGAAFCPLLIACAAIAFEKGYAKSERALVFCSSDGGHRGAICLTPVWS